MHGVNLKWETREKREGGKERGQEEADK